MPDDGTAVPIERVTDSRYRTRLPYAPTSKRLRLAQKEIERSGYPVLPAREIDGRYEVLGHELLLDAIRASGARTVRIRPVTPRSEEEAYLYGKTEHVKHAGRPSHYEFMRDVWKTAELEGQGITWTRIGALKHYSKSTISHAKVDGERITPAVVHRAGIDERDPDVAERLRALGGKRLRWAGQGEAEDDRAIRLSLLVRGEAPGWAKEAQIESNQEERPAAVLRERKSRGGRVSAVVEVDLARATKADLERIARELRALHKRHQDEPVGGEAT